MYFSLNSNFKFLIKSLMIFKVCKGNCGINEGPCYSNEDCKIGLACGRDKCSKVTHFQQHLFDCCEECKHN